MPTASTTRKAARKQAHRVPAAPIPDKLYFRIGEVAALCAVQAYVLRFWESEFTALRPNKSGTGQRLYRRKDVETALHIRHLLYEEGYTIAGARQALKQEGKQSATAASSTTSTASGSTTDEQAKQRPLQFAAATRSPAEAQLDRLRQDLRSLLVQLSGPPVSAVHAINSGNRAGSRNRRPVPPDSALF
jgi:DNA-binding transcriptional MerR regulator